MNGNIGMLKGGGYLRKIHGFEGQNMEGWISGENK